MAWLPYAHVFVVAVLLATLPGAAAAWALRLRGLTFFAAAVPASFAIIGLAAFAAPFVGLSWGLVPVLLVAAVITLLLLPLRMLTRAQPVSAASPDPTLRSAITTGAAILVATGLISLSLASAIAEPESFSQTYDAVFHLNATAHIIDTGNASPLQLNIASDPASFYPGTWHATVALIAGVTGTSVAAATNVFALTVASWVWPIAILFFSRPFFVRRPAHLLLGAVLATVFTAFPYLLLAWGVLYPNLLSTALIPFALGFLYLALRSRTVGAGVPIWSAWVAALGSIGAAALAHPNALFGIALFTVPIFTVVARDIARSDLSRAAKTARWTGLALTVLAFAIAWRPLSTSESREPGLDPLTAFLDAATNAPLLHTRSWFLTVLVFGGAIALLIGKRHRWLIGSYALALLLCTLAGGFSGPIRDLLTGPWYGDAARFAVLIPIAAIPLAGAASAMLFDLVTGGLKEFAPERVGERSRRHLPFIGGAIVFALVLTGARAGSFTSQTGWIRDLHQVHFSSELLDPNELALIQRLADLTPEDALIAGDPWSGSSLVYALGGREVLYPHLQGSYSQDAQELAANFSQLGADACVLLERLGVDYLFDSGSPLYDVNDPEAVAPYQGLRRMASSPVLEEVAREGRAVLYRVDC